MVTMGRRRTVAATLSVLALTVGGLGPSADRAAAYYDDLTVASVSYSSSTVSVSGVETVPLTVTMHVTSGTPITTTPCVSTGEWGCPLSIELDRTAGSGEIAEMGADAAIVSGTGTDGVWEAIVSVPSTAAGTWTVTAAWLPCMGCDGRHPVTGAPTFTVEGSHLPHLSTGTSPAIVPLGASPYTVKGRLTDTATGLPIAGVTVALGVDSSCVEGSLGRYRIVTSSNGYYTFPSLSGNYDKTSLNCVWVGGRDWGGRGRRITIAGRVVPLAVRTWVSAAAATTRARVGTSVVIAGSVGGAPLVCPVLLQRLYGSTAWRTVDRAGIRLSGRYTLHAPLTVDGANRFRVLLPACGHWVAVATGQVIIYGT